MKYARFDINGDIVGLYMVNDPNFVITSDFVIVEDFEVNDKDYEVDMKTKLTIAR